MERFHNLLRVEQAIQVETAQISSWLACAYCIEASARQDVVEEDPYSSRAS